MRRRRRWYQQRPCSRSGETARRIWIDRLHETWRVHGDLYPPDLSAWMREHIRDQQSFEVVDDGEPTDSSRAAGGDSVTPQIHHLDTAGEGACEDCGARGQIAHGCLVCLHLLCGSCALRHDCIEGHQLLTIAHALGGVSRERARQILLGAVLAFQKHARKVAPELLEAA